MVGINYRVPVIDAAKCQACRQCLARKACRLKALAQFEAHELPYVDRELCRGCLLCLAECPFQAIVAE